ncbi:MAG: TetR/AcrR family transcriptional regulator [Propionibacteriales bacterium]|nr:TetR/AcrR family transcriptional regulator [Propionibacteriales bacterium]
MSAGVRRAEEPTKAERTRQRILDSAAHELARHGYGGTSLRAVAAGADLQMPSLYFHFASKDELVAATMADGIESTLARIQDTLRELPPTASPGDRLQAAITAHLGAMTDHHDHAAAVIRMSTTLPTALQRTHHLNEQSYVALWADLIRAAQADELVDPEVDAGVLAGFVIGGLNGYLDAPPERVAEVSTTVFALLTAGRRA